MDVRACFHRCCWLLLLALAGVCGGPALAQEGPRWLIDGHPGADANEAIGLLLAAGADGLQPDDYQAGALARMAAANAATEPAFGPALTRAMERFISDLHFGRVAPREAHMAFKRAPKQLDPAAYLRAAVASHTLTAAVRAAAPRLPQYARLRAALAQYRALAKHPALQGRLPLPPAGKVEPGQPYPGAAGLARRLSALGDLPPGASAGSRYEGALVAGVKAFQSRHGMTADGVLGKSTLAQLNTPVAARIGQIALTLERLRWTPLLAGERMIVVNVPEFVLRAYDLTDGAERLSMNVIVGKALNTRTPLFLEDMQMIEFSPYWNIPPSIAKAEIVPRLLRDPAYFAIQGLEFVDPDGRVIPTLSKANLDAVLHGKLRLRQRPGERNALGDVKFIFPNNDNIYLHHTPQTSLFKRERRDFSHGCIRVADPLALAKFVLQQQPYWTEQRIRAVMDSGRSQTLRLTHRLPVLIAYATVVVKRDGKVHFFNDIYGNDKLLGLALLKKQRASRAARAA